MLRINTEKKEYCVEYWDGCIDKKTSRPFKEEDILARFYGHPLTPSELTRLLEKHRIVQWESPDKKTAKQRFEKYDDENFVYDRLCKVLKRWEGITDENGKEIECNDDNKIKAYEHNPGLIKWVIEEFEKIGDSLNAKKEEEKKI